MAKGSGFEREVAKALSMWWSSYERDDIFWRSSNSGGRATARRKRGKTTQGQAGDIAATDPVGAPLMRWLSIECKDGYSIASLDRLVDSPLSRGACTLKDFFAQAATAAIADNAIGWAVIHRRPRRGWLVYIPISALERLPIPPKVWRNLPGWMTFNSHRGRLAVIPFETFLETVRPHHVRNIRQVSD